ncbi:MAG: acyl-CoA dehydrogenase [Chloroflexi bacterium]|nr:acyl-CoA dehydrogenase [Chloroflexota bacterium]
MIAINGNFRVRDERRERLIETVRDLGRRHAAGAALHDQTGTVHRALLDDLCAVGYHAAPINYRHGGGSHRLVDVVLAQAALAESDPATALGIGMHLMVVGSESLARTWPEWRRQELFREVSGDAALFNVLATEPVMGAPQGDAPPATNAAPDGEGRWRLYGEKAYSTFAPVLTYAVVYASMGDGSGDVARILVRMADSHVGIEETWDTAGMRATASHTVHFAGVPISDRDILARFPFSRRASRPAMSPWFALPVAAVYLGIARAARDEAVRAIQRPRGGQTSAAASEVRRLLAEIERRLLVSEAILVSAAAEADGEQRTAPGLSPLEAAAKVEVTQSAITVVDLAVRIAGGGALKRGSRLERAWRDVRCGSVHPPTEAGANALLAEHALARHLP